MPTCGTSEIQREAEVKTKRTDKSKHWLGICQEEAETERLHTRVGWVLPPSQYETSLRADRWMVKTEDTNVYMEVLEETQNKGGELH